MGIVKTRREISCERPTTPFGVDGKGVNALMPGGVSSSHTVIMWDKRKLPFWF